MDYRILGMRGECRYVVPETAGQYTGLTDKNGKRIFEGDIVECWSEGVCARGAVQQRSNGTWIIYPAWQKYITWSLCPDDYLHTTVEVVGNIHDNPELAEVNKLLQKPMPLEEADYKWYLITLEKKGEDKLLLGDMTGSVEDSLISFVGDDPYDTRGIEKLEKNDYGKTWRFWEHFPTEEERGAAEWLKP